MRHFLIAKWINSWAGEGIAYPLQYSWASLVAQLVKNPPAMRETWVRSLGWEGTLEKGTATHYSILARRIPWTVYSMGSQRVEYDWATFTLYTIHTMLHKEYLINELFVLENSQSTRKPLHPPPLKTKSRFKREGTYVYLCLLYGSSVQLLSRTLCNPTDCAH